MILMKFSDNVENRWLKLLTFRIHVIFQRPKAKINDQDQEAKGL